MSGGVLPRKKTVENIEENVHRESNRLGGAKRSQNFKVKFRTKKLSAATINGKQSSKRARLSRFLKFAK